MAGTDVERLRLRQAASASHDWMGANLERTVEATCETAGVVGQRLPPTVVYRSAVVPVITWDLNALAQRLRSGRAPILERAALRGLHDGHAPAPAPVSLQAFVCLGPLSRAKGDLAVLGIYAQAVWVAPAPPGAARWDAMECDLRGFTVVQAWDDRAELVLAGHRGPDPSRRPMPVQAWLYREQLFDVAIRSGLVPPL